MAADRRRLAQRRDQRIVDVVDLDRREPQALEARRRARRADEPRQVVAGVAVAVAAEVDPREDDLTVALRDAARDLAQHGVGAAAARRAAHERDDAEVARERAAVLHLHERAHAVEPRVRLDAADRADVAGDEGGRLLAALRDDDDVLGQSGERVAREVRAAARHVDAAVRARCARGFLARLRDGLVRHAAGVDDRDVGAASGSTCPSASSRSRTSCASTCETLQPRKRTEKLAIGADAKRVRAGPQPSRRARAGRRGASPRHAARPGRGSRTSRRAGAPRRGSRRSTTSSATFATARSVSRKLARRARRRERAASSTPFTRAFSSVASIAASSMSIADDRREAELRGGDREHARSAADVEQAARLELLQQLEREPRRRMRAGAERAARIDHDRLDAGGAASHGGPTQKRPTTTP